VSASGTVYYLATTAASCSASVAFWPVVRCPTDAAAQWWARVEVMRQDADSYSYRSNGRTYNGSKPALKAVGLTLDGK
jgi:hypothetical protein